MTSTNLQKEIVESGRVSLSGDGLLSPVLSAHITGTFVKPCLSKDSGLNLCDLNPNLQAVMLVLLICI